MNYLIFDNNIYYEIGAATGSVPQDKLLDLFKGSSKEASVVIIDSLQKQIVAPEKSISKKEEAIASAFTGDYLIQSEQTGENLFQVIGIEKLKVAQVYKRLGFENVKLILPYGLALREFLKGNKLFSQNKRIIFLDYLGDQVLLTIFHNEEFSAPRRLSVAIKRVVSELKRSQENYKALNKEEKEISFLIATNNKEILDELVLSGVEAKENIVYFPDAYPALSALKQAKFSMHYLLPEQFIRLRKMKEVKKRLFKLVLMFMVLAVSLILLLASFSAKRGLLLRLKDLRLEEAYQDKLLRSAYAAKYKDILRQEKKINFPYFFYSFINSLPSEYKIESITIKSLSRGRYRLEAVVYQEAKDKPFAKLFLPRAFKGARVENILLRGEPGIRVTLEIF